MSEEGLDEGSMWVGLAIAVGLDIAGIVALLVCGVLAGVLYIGLVQLLWLTPAYLHFSSVGRTETAKGIAIAAGICGLLNAACWGLIR